MTPHDENDAADVAVDDVAPAWGVDGVLAALAHAEAPPADVRAAVLARATARPPEALAGVDPVELYRRRVDALRALLATLGAGDWQRQAAPYDWSVHGLVAHLLQIERYTLGALRGDTLDELPGTDHLAVGIDEIDRELADEPANTAIAWSAAAGDVLALVSSQAYAPTEAAPLHGWALTQSSTVIARAFEIWTHTEDIARAIGRSPGVVEMLPSPSELRTMSSASVTALPALLPLRRPGRTMGPTRVVLTGAGGGTFDIGPEAAERAALVAIDVVDYCRVAARRLAVADVEAVREGDLDLIDDLLVAAGAMAM